MRACRNVHIASSFHRTAHRSRELLLYSFRRCLMKLSSYRTGLCAWDRGAQGMYQLSWTFQWGWKTGCVCPNHQRGKPRRKVKSGVSGEGDDGSAEELWMVLWRRHTWTWCEGCALRGMEEEYLSVNALCLHQVCPPLSLLRVCWRRTRLSARIRAQSCSCYGRPRSAHKGGCFSCFMVLPAQVSLPSTLPRIGKLVVGLLLASERGFWPRPRCASASRPRPHVLCACALPPSGPSSRHRTESRCFSHGCLHSLGLPFPGARLLGWASFRGEGTQTAQARSSTALSPEALAALLSACPSGGLAQPSCLHRRATFPTLPGSQCGPPRFAGVAAAAPLALLLSRLPLTGPSSGSSLLSHCLLSFVSCSLFPLDLGEERKHQDARTATPEQNREMLDDASLSQQPVPWFPRDSL